MVANQPCRFTTLEDGKVVCEYCGYNPKLNRPLNRDCPKLSKQRIKLVCKYLGDQLLPILVPCVTCKGRVSIKYQANECSLHGPCLTDYSSPVNGYTLCTFCTDKKYDIQQVD
jgi:hypothetical protein